MNKGVLQALGAYVAWGVLPIYWRALQAIPSDLLLAHRVVWSFGAMFLILSITRRLGGFGVALRDWRSMGRYGLSAILIGLNWILYVWAVNAGYVVETSLGYFINPLLSVMLGVLIFKERLRPLQWVPLGLAALGVVQLTVAYGRLPWIALVLASTFASYGLIKKTARLGALEGLGIETLLLFPLGLLWLLVAGGADRPEVWPAEASARWLLIGTGAVTTLPFVLFSAAARKIPLTVIGLLQYTAPTLQFLIGVFVFREAFSASKLLGFSLVWLALALFAVESFGFRRRMRDTTVPPVG